MVEVACLAGLKQHPSARRATGFLDRDQCDHEWVLVLRGSACVALQNPDRIVDLSPGDHLLLSPHQRHRVERTDPDPGTLWLALHWDAA